MAGSDTPDLAAVRQTCATTMFESAGDVWQGNIVLDYDRCRGRCKFRDLEMGDLRNGFAAGMKSPRSMVILVFRSWMRTIVLYACIRAPLG